MEFRGMEALVLDVLRTKELQRLRRVRQLGLAHLVFPGAEHSRLVHVLGASYLAIRFARRLQDASRGFLIDELTPNDSALRDMAIAALCHDLGHGPLSHVWEREIIGKHFERRKWCVALGLDEHFDDQEELKWHELVTQALLAWQDGQLFKLLETYETGFAERVRQLLLGNYYLPYLPRLLASDIDVDRADFLKRDTHQTGVAYGAYDLEWLVSTCTVGKTSHGELVVGFDDRKAPRVVEQFLIARRALYDTVYHHKTVRGAEGMVAQFLRKLREVIQKDGRGIPANVGFVEPLLRTVAGEAISPEELLSIDDFALWVLIDYMSNREDIDITVRDLGQRILGRDLFKLVPDVHRRANEFLRREGAYERLYKAIQPFCPGEAKFYLIVDAPDFAMLSEKPKHWCYFVDKDRRAVPAKDHDAFRHHSSHPEELVRLYTLSEAVEEVAKVLA
jgi:HD superfamily phosphohydrolase